MVRRFLKRHILWFGFLAVALPLGILVSLQYGWLTSLEKTSAIAETAALDNYLDAVVQDVEYFYWKQAERALNIPGFYIREKPLEDAIRYFKKKDPQGGKYLFIVKYTKGDSWGDRRVYNPRTRRLEEPEDVRTDQAIYVALAPWKTLAHEEVQLQFHEFRVDETDPLNRIILKPITNDADKIIGVAGMVVDNDFFREEVLPAAIKHSLPDFFDKKNFSITVRDGRDRLVWGWEPEEEVVERSSASIPFIFSDWTLHLGRLFRTPEQLARSNFLINVTLSVLLTIALLGGIAFALRTVSREMRLSKMKSDFVSNVSHELRTPLASIRVFGEFLRLGRVRDDEKSREYGEYIETESRRLTQLINNILDFSRIESGAKTYHFERSNLEDVIRDTLRTLEVSVRHRGFKLVFHEPDKPLPPMEIDSDAMGQALTNLVGNAVKYSNGASQIEVFLRRRGESIQIAVRDEGIGISRDEQKKIFERFHRVGTGLVHDVKGSGLGLSIVSHVINAHGGEVTVDSELGKGSTFTIHLPLSKLQVTETVTSMVASSPSMGEVGKS
jgi:signal transduction histidine kinase